MGNLSPDRRLHGPDSSDKSVFPKQLTDACEKLDDQTLSPDERQKFIDLILTHERADWKESTVKELGEQLYQGGIDLNIETMKNAKCAVALEALSRGIAHLPDDERVNALAAFFKQARAVSPNWSVNPIGKYFESLLQCTDGRELRQALAVLSADPDYTLAVLAKISYDYATEDNRQIVNDHVAGLINTSLAKPEKSLQSVQHFRAKQLVFMPEHERMQACKEIIDVFPSMEGNFPMAEIMLGSLSEENRLQAFEHIVATVDRQNVPYDVLLKLISELPDDQRLPAWMRVAALSNTPQHMKKMLQAMGSLNSNDRMEAIKFSMKASPITTPEHAQDMANAIRLLPEHQRVSMRDELLSTYSLQDLKGKSAQDIYALGHLLKAIGKDLMTPREVFVFLRSKNALSHAIRSGEKELIAAVGELLLDNIKNPRYRGELLEQPEALKGAMDSKCGPAVTAYAQLITSAGKTLDKAQKKHLLEQLRGAQGKRPWYAMGFMVNNTEYKALGAEVRKAYKEAKAELKK